LPGRTEGQHSPILVVGRGSTRAQTHVCPGAREVQEPQMQVTIDTRHDTLEEAIAVIQLAFAHRKDPGAAQGTVEPTGPGRRPKAGRSGGGRGARRAASARNDAVAPPAPDDGSANQAPADAGVSAAAVDDAASRRARATARTAPTKKTAARKGATDTAPTKKAPVKRAAVKKAAASRSAMKRAPASRSAASRYTVGSNAAPAGQADVVRAWARDQGMQVKAAGRMPAAVITAYHEAHS